MMIWKKWKRFTPFYCKATQLVKGCKSAGAVTEQWGAQQHKNQTTKQNKQLEVTT